MTHLKQQKSLGFFLVLHWAVDVIEVIYYIRGPVENMMGCNHPSCVPVGSLVGELWHFECFFNMAAVRHFEFCYSGPLTKSTMRFDYAVKIWYRSDIPRRTYYDCIILPVWLKNA